MYTRLHVINFGKNIQTLLYKYIVLTDWRAECRLCSATPPTQKMSLLPVALCLGLLAHKVDGKVAFAPGDFETECYSYATPSAENEKILLDSQYYSSASLLTATGGNRTWLSLDFDKSSGDTSEKVQPVLTIPVTLTVGMFIDDFDSYRMTVY